MITAKHPSAVSLLMVIMAFNLFAQGAKTWEGLTFGSTESQVRAALGKRMTEPTEDEQPVDKSYGLYAAGIIRDAAVKGFTGKATILFDKATKRLARINLMLTPFKNSSDEDERAAYEQLRDNLLKKYGAPLSRIGCQGEDLGCKLTFKANGQAVNVDAVARDGVPLSVFISYEPIKAIKGI
jgi:hypothetical protein